MILLYIGYSAFLLKIGNLKQQEILLFRSAQEGGIEGCSVLSTLTR